jgi:hypothetical protein
MEHEARAVEADRQHLAAHLAATDVAMDAEKSLRKKHQADAAHARAVVNALEVAAAESSDRIRELSMNLDAARLAADERRDIWNVPLVHGCTA